MSEFFDWGDSETKTSKETIVGGEPRWYRIHGSDNGMKLKFWLWSVSEEEVRSKATKDGIADITKIIQKDPPFL
jgi:hypothetical protein|tara:strand:+ start:2015 stop:2236 length:222 start_codon:yes stop_codon:yes gene_type:complete